MYLTNSPVAQGLRKCCIEKNKGLHCKEDSFGKEVKDLWEQGVWGRINHSDNSNECYFMFLTEAKTFFQAGSFLNLFILSLEKADSSGSSSNLEQFSGNPPILPISSHFQILWGTRRERIPAEMCLQSPKPKGLLSATEKHHDGHVPIQLGAWADKIFPAKKSNSREREIFFFKSMEKRLLIREADLSFYYWR